MNRKEKTRAVKKSVIEVLGNQGLNIPSAVDSKDFVKARLQEINLLSKELEQAKYSATRRVFQQLPRHMRRRAASYNIKRLPVRLRLKAMEESKNDTHKGKKLSNMKNCRRWRRRPSNISSMVCKSGWLETHLWHAKRCKMIDYWGFKVAAHLNEKCLKSSYRSSISGGLLHDMSYWHAFSATSFNISRFKIDFGEKSIYDLVIEMDSVQICPIKIFLDSLSSPLILFHPASVQTGILGHPAFKIFVDTYSVEISDISEHLSIFKLEGRMSLSIISNVLKLKDSPTSSLRLMCADPRLYDSFCEPISVIKISDFVNSPACKREKDINDIKSTLFLPENPKAIDSTTLKDSTGIFPLIITAKSPENYIFCPRKWARTLWYQFIKAKHIKVAGIEQVEYVTFEQGNPVYPRDYVGSPAYEVWAESEKCRLQSIHDRKPPAKRPSFEKLGIYSPFKADFSGMGHLIKVSVQIDGRGILNVFDEILTPAHECIGFITSSTPSSLKRGNSFGIASVKKDEFTSDFEMKVFIRSIKSGEMLRSASIKKI